MTFTFLGKQYTFDFSLQGDRAILVVCMGIALFMWFFTKMSNRYSTERVVDVNFVLPKGQAFAELPAEKLVATIEGQGWNLMNDYLFGGQSEITVNLEMEPTRYIEQSTILSRITNPSMEKRGLKILKTNPSFLYLNYEKEIQKKVPVKASTTISYALGHFPTGVLRVYPDSIQIKGAKVILDTITYWETESFLLDNLESSIEVIVPLKKQFQKHVFLSEKEVKVVLPVEEWTEKQLFYEVKIKNSTDSLKLFPKITEVTFSCPLSLFNDITEEDFELVVDLKNVPMNEENNTVPVLITKSPETVKSIKISPKSVQFFFLSNKKQEE